MLFIFSLFTRTNVGPQPKKTPLEVLTRLAGGHSTSLIAERRAKRIACAKQVEPIALPVFALQPKNTPLEVLTRLAGNGSKSLIAERRAKRIACAEQVEPIVLPVFGPRTKQEQLAARNRAIEILRNGSSL
jgi:hypothetical protein